MKIESSKSQKWGRVFELVFGPDGYIVIDIVAAVGK